MHRISTGRFGRKLTLVTSGMRNREAEDRDRREIFLLRPLESFTFGNRNVIPDLKNKIKLNNPIIQQNPMQ